MGSLRSIGLLALTLAVSLSFGSELGAQVPVNDTCAGALDIVCNDVVSGSTVQATPESLPFCGTSDGDGGAVWYRFVGTGNEIVISTCNAGSNYDTKLRVYSGSCGNLVCVGGNDDSSCTFDGLRSEVSWVSVVGVDYYIVVHGFGMNSGNYELSLACLAPPAPDPNDDCVNAIAMNSGDVVLGDTQANNDDGEASCGSTSNSPSVWYSIVATETLLRVQTCGSSFNTVLSVHSACPGDQANEVDCADNGCGLQSLLEATVVPGNTYFIRVSGANGAAGPFTLRVDNLDPTTFIGPDVVYTDCRSVTNWGQVGGTRAYSLGSWTCNIGDENLLWGTNTPLLAMNAYRLEGGRLTQIGLSFVKRGTGAAVGSGCGLPCNGQGGSVLGAGCRDIYGSGFNGSQGILGPRSTVNAFTGDYPGDSGSSPTVISKRLQVREADLTGSGQYFVEGVYVAPDDALSGNAFNNASYKRVDVTGASFDMTPTGDMEVTIPAIQAWADHGLGPNTPDPSVVIAPVDIPNEGRFHIACKTTDLGGGQWLYDYAVFNLNSHRSGGSFSVPVGAGVTVSNAGFHDVDYHSGETYDLTDWSFSVTGSAATWTSPETFAENPDSNALRWGTMYNFWFEADAAPQSVNATLGLFRPGTPDSITTAVNGPGVSIELDRGDCNADDNFDIADVVFLLDLLFAAGTASPCSDACDVNDDGALDISDPIRGLDRLFAAGDVLPDPFGACGPDPTLDGLGCAVSAFCP